MSSEKSMSKSGGARKGSDRPSTTSPVRKSKQVEPFETGFENTSGQPISPVVNFHTAIDATTYRNESFLDDHAFVESANGIECNG